jgi:hypothetical protein
MYSLAGGADRLRMPEPLPGMPRIMEAARGPRGPPRANSRKPLKVQEIRITNESASQPRFT